MSHEYERALVGLARSFYRGVAAERPMNGPYQPTMHGVRDGQPVFQGLVLSSNPPATAHKLIADLGLDFVFLLAEARFVEVNTHTGAARTTGLLIVVLVDKHGFGFMLSGPADFDGDGKPLAGGPCKLSSLDSVDGWHLEARDPNAPHASVGDA